MPQSRLTTGLLALAQKNNNNNLVWIAIQKKNWFGLQYFTLDGTITLSTQMDFAPMQLFNCSGFRGKFVYGIVELTDSDVMGLGRVLKAKNKNG